MSLKCQNVVVHRLVESQVKKTPDAIAVRFYNQSLTYHKLNAKANQLANYLVEKGIGKGSVVGIYAERSLEQIIALLAILKTGAAYLPLDLAYPVDRLNYMLNDSDASMLVTQNHLLSKLQLSHIPSICLDNNENSLREFSSNNLDSSDDASAGAYVIYTSGSTGKPKGVLMPHRPLVNLLSWQQSDLAYSNATTLQFTPVSFDVSFQEIFSTLSSGGELILITESVRRDPEALLAYISEYRIERLFLPFVALQHVAEAAVDQPNLCLSLKEVITAGEQLKITRSISNWFQSMSDCLLYNHYGPSESHVVTSYALSGSAKDWPHLPPIGSAISNTHIYLLNPQSQRENDVLELVQPGEVGELAIGGVSLANGYINKPDLTERKFILDPFSSAPNARLYRTGDLVRLNTDGVYEYIARIDNQVKIRGFRIELGEIEATLSQADCVKDVAVIARESAAGTRNLVAYLVANQTSAKNEQELIKSCKAYLKINLPSYMVPSIFVVMDSLPLTPSGKVDRRALPEPQQNRSDFNESFALPQTETEKKMSDVWFQLLDIKPIGSHDDFFELGGNSLQVVQLSQLIEKTFRVKLPISTFFKNSTLKALSKTLESIIETQKDTDVKESNIVVEEQDIKLDESITVSGLPTEIRNTPNSIFLTGTTGYFGTFLLSELLVKTSASVYCLVRAESLEQGKTRIQSNLVDFGLWQPQYANRIIPIPGDLGKSNLGLSEDIFTMLAQRIDTVYHCGAWVNMVYPYSVLKHTNVFSTREILRLASQAKIKPVHFISTIDVYSVEETSFRSIEDKDSIGPVNRLSNGYARSKYVAEQLVMLGSKRGIPISIYRPSNIIGPVKTNIYPKNSLVSLMIEGCIQLGVAPEIDSIMNLVPADYASQMTVYLSLKPDSIGKSFNIVNPKSVSWQETIAEVTNSGRELEVIDYECWLERLRSLPKTSDNVLLPLLTLLKDKKLIRKSLGAFDFNADCANDFISECQLDMKSIVDAYFTYARIFCSMSSTPVCS